MNEPSPNSQNHMSAAANQQTAPQPPPEAPDDDQPEPPSDDPLEVRVLRHVRQSGLYLFRDPLGTPCVRLPNDPTRKRWPVVSEYFERWIAHSYEEQTSDILPGTIIKQVIRVLAGEAAQKPMEKGDKHDIWQTFDGEPVLQALIAFMDGHEELWEERTRHLLALLKERAHEAGIWTDSPKWPKATQVLSAKLNRYSDLLKQIGLRCEVTHMRNGSFTHLEWMPGSDARDTAPFEPPPGPSRSGDGNSTSGDAGEADDADPLFQQAAERVRQTDADYMNTTSNGDSDE